MRGFDAFYTALEKMLSFSRDKMATDKKLLTSKMDEDNDDRRKEISSMKANIQKEREELRGQVSLGRL